MERSPDSIALTFGDQCLSYRELNGRSNQLAHRLLREGVERGSFVAMFLDRTLESVVATLGILKAGAVYVPVDVAYPRQRVEFMLGDACVRVVVTHLSHLAELPEVGCPSSVHELFELQVERSPDSIALTFGDQCLSYRELNERSNQLAHRLLREGVERGSVS